MNTKSYRRGFRAGFTLIELLTVIAIIGILAAILIPVVGSVREHARRAKCASNLRQHGFAHNLYRDDHGGRYMDGAASSPAHPHWISAEQREILGGYGIEWELYFCPSNEGWNSSFMLEEFRVSSGSIVMGYVYWPGSSLAGFQTLTDPLPYDLIMVDIVRKHNGAWKTGINHSDGMDSVAGANHLRVDGSVEWVPGADFMNEGPYTAGSVQWYFKNPVEDVPVTR